MDKQECLGCIVTLFILVFCGYTYYEKEGFELKCLVASKDGNNYCVRERSKLDDAANLLAIVTEKCKQLVKYVQEQDPEKDAVKRLIKGYNPNKIMETLPTSKYTAYSENKGEKLAFCLNVKNDDNDNLIDEHTLVFVAIHELAHIMTESIGHKTEFWDNFKYLLVKASDAGIHKPHDYKQEPREYCSMKITDNPFYDA
jgi:hypothetical protein